jgi:hypothetical protein
MPLGALASNGQQRTLQGITGMGESSARQTPDHRLDSWKEIAAFFGRDERTVRRWEKERGLPAHRVPGGARGGVFAYTAELREWLKGPGSELEASESGPSWAVSKRSAADHGFGPEGSAPENVAGNLVETPVANLAANLVANKDVANNVANNDEEKSIAGAYSPLPAKPHILAPVLELRPAAGVPFPARSRPPIARIVAWLAPLLAVTVLIVVFSASHRETFYKNALAALHPPNSEAQDLYLKGEYHRTKRTPEDLNKAVDYFTQSIVKDPSYAPAYVGLADCYNLLREFSVMPPEEAYPRALAAAQKAVELDDTLASAHTSLAFPTFYWNWDPASAEHEYKRALELDANFVQGHHWYATFLLTSGRFSEALEQIELARKLDPSSTAILADKGLILFDSGRKGEALGLLKQLASTDSALATTHGYLAKIYFDRKAYANFFAELKQSAQLRHDDAGSAIANAAEQGFAAGGLDGMREAMLPVQKEIFDRGSGSAYDVAATCALLDRKEEAVRYLQAAYDKREIGMLYVNRNPDFNGLRNDSGYQEIAERVSKRLLGNPLPGNPQP